jgi:hypothetical protein
VELREQVANKFAERHLKALLNDKVFNQFRKTISAEVDKAISNCLARTERHGWRTQVTLTEGIREKIRDAVQAEAASVFDPTTIQAHIDERMRHHQDRATTLVRKAVDNAITERKIDEIVRERIIQRLDMAATMEGGPDRERVIDVA